MVSPPRLLILALFAVVPFPAEGAEYACPAVFAIRQEIRTELPAGWSGRTVDWPAPLSHVLFFDGDPKNQAGLAPGRTVRSGNDEVSVWPLEPLNPTDRPTWLACEYAGTQLFLARPLPLSVKECRVYYGPKDAIRRIVCD